MNEFFIISTLIIPIIILLITAGFAKASTDVELVKRLSTVAPFLGLFSSAFGVFWVLTHGMFQSPLYGTSELGFALRIDQLSIILYGMVSIISMVILRFSYNYLDGDSQHVKFIGRLSITVAFVQLLVLSGNLFQLWICWVATSLALHQLLIFYPERKKARLAAIKKFVFARIGDFTLLTAFVLIFLKFGTGDLGIIFNHLSQIKLGSWELELAAILLVLTAGLKSAQIPFHGWLLDVMEAPTPVSALLHAGLLNAGPFLIIRFAYLLDVTSVAPIMLFTMGATTAFFGAIVFTTQPMVKTALAYSSVAHMGFTLMVCGLGVYSASLLHLVGHSFYKAHAFLSSGSIVEKVRTKQAAHFKRKGSVWRMLLGLGMAVFLYVLVAQLWKVNAQTEYQLLIIGGIIFTGIISLLINAIDSSNYKFSTLIILLGTIGVLTAFFSLEHLMKAYLASQIPVLKHLDFTMMYLSGITLAVFFFTVFIQTLSPILEKNDMFRSIGVHARNGFYLNEMMDSLFSPLQKKNF